MRLPRLAVYLALGFGVASLLSFLFAEGGVLEYRAADRYRRQLEQNIAELQGINEGLLDDLEALRSDPELLRLQARSLGYFRPDEHVIRILDRAQPGNFYAIGRLILRRPAARRPVWYFRLTGLGLPALLLLARTVLVLAARLRRRKGDARSG